VARYLLRYKGEKILLAPGKFTVGRGVDSSLHLDDELASRNHAVLHVGHDHLEVEDLESRNGVFLNGVKVAGRAPLKHGDAIAIGAQKLEVIEEEERLRRAAMSTVGHEDASRRLEEALREKTGRRGLPEELRQLSPRELEVLKLVAHGHTHKEIAEKLRVSVKTIETYRARIASKMGLKTRAELVKYAIGAGLLQNDG
jgi:DNA-binding CsgD family transcriptional regulator